MPRAKSKYKYYVDNFKQEEDSGQIKRRNTTNYDKPDIPKVGAPTKARASANMPRTSSKSGLKEDKPTFNDWLNEDQEKDKSPEKEEKPVKKPFLARGSGVAGGGKALQVSN